MVKFKSIEHMLKMHTDGRVNMGHSRNRVIGTSLQLFAVREFTGAECIPMGTLTQPDSSHPGYREAFDALMKKKECLNVAMWRIPIYDIHYKVFTDDAAEEMQRYIDTELTDVDPDAISRSRHILTWQK